MNIFDMIFSSGESADLNSNNEDSVEEFVKESVNHLFNTLPNVTTKELEAEGIYLAAYVYLKDSYQIDFEIDYISKNLIDKIPSGNYTVSDKVFIYMMKYGRGLYTKEEADYGVGGYKMNIQLCQDYGSYIKNYFIRAHKIGDSKQYSHFCSPINSLWRGGNKVGESPTRRDIYYKIEYGQFELMIPPYNPLVAGYVVSQTAETIECQSSDGKRRFIFHLVNGVVDSIDMYRNDKGDMVKYQK